MEPLTTGAIAVATVLATKALEKIGENIGDTLSHKTQQFLELLKQRLPGTFAAIEQAPEQPLNYGQAVLDIETAAKTDPNISQVIQELTQLAETNPPKNLAEILKEIQAAFANSQHPQGTIFNQNIQKAINVAQNQTNDQRGSTFNI
jgi:ABC-type transporter Mla subunit MlaD